MKKVVLTSIATLFVASPACCPPDGVVESKNPLMGKRGIKTPANAGVLLITNH